MGAPEKTAYSRVWITQWGSAPGHVPEYLAQGRGGPLSQALGDATSIHQPSTEQFGAFEEVAVSRGAEERVTFSIISLFPEDLSKISEYARQRCPVDLHVHFGRCAKPTDFNAGWEKTIILEDAYITTYSLGDVGALEPSEDAKIDETADISAKKFYEVKKLRFAERAQTEVNHEIIAITVCDNVNCGDCMSPSDGCSKVFAVSATTPSSPGTLPEVVFTDDGYVTAGDTYIGTFTVGEDPSDATCVGSNLVIVSNDSNSAHYAPTEDILDGVEAWGETTAGFVANKEPNCITSATSTDTWVGGDAGYIYYSTDPTSAFTVQDAGATTVQDINDIDAFDAEHVVAVGDANVVLYTADGEIWGLVAGPDTVHTPQLTAVCMLDEFTWLVGTADNALWYTEDAGVTWTQKRFFGDTATGGGVGTIKDIKFSTRAVGYMSVTISTTKGRLFRTIDGGHSWYVLPDLSGTMPAADSFNQVATCINPNIVYAGGLADNTFDGIIVKGS